MWLSACRVEDLGCRAWWREEVALAEWAAEELEQLALAGRLDALGDHVEVEALGEGEHRLHEGGIPAAVLEPFDE